MRIYTAMYICASDIACPHTLHRARGMRIRCALQPLLLLLAYTSKTTRADVCRHVSTQDVTAILEATQLRCDTFLEDMELPARYFDSADGDGASFVDCLASKRDRAQMASSAKHTCSCPAGYYDAAFPENNGVYVDVSSHFLHSNVLCNSRCSVYYQQVIQSGFGAKCACQNARGCRFMQRDVGAIMQTVTPAARTHSLLIVPDNLLLRVGLLQCAQTHCKPPTPVSPRAELLCAAHGIDFKRCSSCDAGVCRRAGVQCEQQSVAPYECVKSCAVGYFLSAADSADMRCSECAVCTLDRFEIQQCSPTSQTQCHDCAHGFYLPASKHDKTVCTACPRGHYSVPGTATCVYNTAIPMLADTTSPCLTGRYWDITTQKCSNCGPSWYTSVNGMCVQCPAHEHSTPSAGAQCAPCPFAMVRDATDETCRWCAPGTYPNTTSDLASCVACPPHHINPGGFGECLQCSNVAYATQNATACVVCPPHQRRDANGSCGYCPENHELDAHGVCLSCTSRSVWELCGIGEGISHDCRGQEHPAWSGAPCACGCHQCALAGLALPLRATLDVARCRIQCDGKQRLTGLNLSIAVCADPVQSIREGHVLNPNDSSDQKEYNCQSAILLPRTAHLLDVEHHLMLCSSPSTTLAAHRAQTVRCTDANVTDSPECLDFANATRSRARPLAELAISPQHVVAAYRNTTAVDDCFFCCVDSYQFEQYLSGGLYVCVAKNSTCAESTDGVQTIHYTTRLT